MTKNLKHYVFDIPSPNLPLQELSALLDQKYCLSSGLEQELIQHALSVIDMISLVQDQNVRESDFQQFVIHKKFPDNLFEAFRCGDYITAKQIVFSKDWNLNKIDPKLRIYFTLYRKLFHRLDLSLSQNVPVISIPKEDANLEDKSSIYRQLKTLVKKRKYTAAYEFYLMHQYQFQKDTQIVLDLWLRVLYLEQKNQKTALMKQFDQNYQRGDFERAEILLKELENHSETMGIVPNYDYLHQKVEKKKVDIDRDDFVKRMQLYSWGKYYLELGAYEKCISIMDEYIQLDQDQTVKGYFLRGRAKERLKRYQEAKEDYQKAVAIIPYTTIFYRLGFLQFCSYEFEEALHTFQELEARDPFEVKTVYQLKRIYQRLDDREQQGLYHKKYRALKKMDC